jgi:hypothetical protein
VRDIARAEREVPGARRDRRVADLEGDVALEDPEALVLSVVDVERTSAFGGSVISMMLSSPPVCSAVTLISASAANHQRASPSPCRVAIA